MNLTFVFLFNKIFVITLDKNESLAYNNLVTFYGSIAQLARAHDSYS